MGVLWWSSSRVPGDEPHNTATSLLHNSMHVVAYACIAAAVWLTWSRRPAGDRQPLRSYGSWLIAAGYGIVDELHQSFVPGRD